MIVATGLQFPEGPAFDRDGQLYCCNLTGGYIARIRPDGSPERVLECPGPNGLAIHPVDGSLWVADSVARTVLRGACGAASEQAAAGAFLGPNDLAFAPDGTLYFTDPLGSSAENPIGAVYRRDPSGIVEAVARGLAFPNGLALIAGERALIVAETLRHRLLRIDLDTGAAEPFCDVGRGPDGMAQGLNGHLYVALYREGCVAVVEPGGRVACRLPVQDEHPTNLAFHQGNLFVTLSATGRIERLDVEG